MEIKTKFNVNQDVYFITSQPVFCNGEFVTKPLITKGEVFTIRIDQEGISYAIKIDNAKIAYSGESEMFETLDEAKKYVDENLMEIIS